MLSKKFICGLSALAVTLMISGCTGSGSGESTEYTFSGDSNSGNIRTNVTSAKPVCVTNDTLFVGETGNTSHSSTSRNIAIDSDGVIYVAYHGQNGINVIRSIDGGEIFSNPIQITSDDYEVSINVSNDNTVYVAWVDNANSTINMSKSLDKGVTFENPKVVGSTPTGGFFGNDTLHIASDEEHIYIVTKGGTTLYVSHDHGSTFSEVNISQDGKAFADVRVDRTTHKVYVQTDDPTLRYYVSTDYGDTISSERVPGGAIFYSTTAFSGYENGAYLFVSGIDTDAYRIDLDANTSEALVFGDNQVSMGRSLAADNIGNVVDGYQKTDTNGTVTSYFAVSQNIGEDFDAEVKVDDNTTNISVAIDSPCSNVVVAYMKDDKVHINTYVGKLATE